MLTYAVVCGCAARTLRLRSEDGKISLLQKAHFIGPDPRTLQK